MSISPAAMQSQESPRGLESEEDIPHAAAAAPLSLTGYVQRVVEGARPSLEQVTRWFENQTFIRITAVDPWEPELSESLQGRISRIGPFISQQHADAIISIEGHPFGVYVRNITAFQAEEPVRVKTEQDVLLISGEERFIISRDLLQTKIPCFQSIGGFGESIEDEIDLSLLVSPNQLKLIMQYVHQVSRNPVLQGGVFHIRIWEEFETPSKSFPVLQGGVHGGLECRKLDTSVAIELFMAANCLCIEELKDLLLESCESLSQFDSLLNGDPISELTFDSRVSTDSILLAFKLANNMGTKIEKLHMPYLMRGQLGELAEALQGNIDLQSLDFTLKLSLAPANRDWNDDDAPLLQRLVQGLPSLRELKIGNQKLGDNWLRAIAVVLADHPSLETLDLSLNSFSSAGFDDFTEILLRNRTLKSLHLTCNDIGPNLSNNGRYVRALSRNTSLEHLRLWSNCIYDYGAAGFATVIMENTHLKTLDLGGNRITPQGRSRLEEALTFNTSLTDVRVNSDDSFRPSIVLRGAPQ